MTVETLSIEQAGTIAQSAFSRPVTSRDLGSPDRMLELASACGWSRASKPIDFAWQQASDGETLDRMLALSPRSPSGRMLLVPDYSFTRGVVFMTTADELRAFVEGFGDGYDEPFFNGMDVLVIDVEGAALWLFHHEAWLFAAWKE